MHQKQVEHDHEIHNHIQQTNSQQSFTVMNGQRSLTATWQQDNQSKGLKLIRYYRVWFMEQSIRQKDDTNKCSLVLCPPVWSRHFWCLVHARDRRDCKQALPIHCLCGPGVSVWLSPKRHHPVYNAPARNQWVFPLGCCNCLGHIKGLRKNSKSWGLVQRGVWSVGRCPSGLCP